MNYGEISMSWSLTPGPHISHHDWVINASWKILLGNYLNTKNIMIIFVLSGWKKHKILNHTAYTFIIYEVTTTAECPL